MSGADAMDGSQFANLLEIGALPEEGPRLNVLMLADTSHPAGVVRDHIAGLRSNSRHRWYAVNPLGSTWAGAGDWDCFDAIVIHYSVHTLGEYFLNPALAARLAAYGGAKIQIIQDEYRRINAMKRRMRELGITDVVSSLSTGNLPLVYGDIAGAAVRFYSNLPGYVAPRLLNRRCPRSGERAIDVFYRGRPVPYWLGRAAQEKNEIWKQFLAGAQGHELECDIAGRESSRVYGRRWEAALVSAKATLGVEGGASIFDFEEKAESAAREYLRTRPTAPFEEVWESVLQPFEGNVVHRTITPRIFEAAALRAALCLYPGEYSGYLERWRHYIPVERDGSNLREVAGYLKDIPFLQELTSRVYEEVALKPEVSARHFAASMDRLLEGSVRRQGVRHGSRARAVMVTGMWRGGLLPARAVSDLGAIARRKMASAWIGGRLNGRLDVAWTRSFSRSSRLDGVNRDQNGLRDVLMIANCDLAYGEQRRNIAAHLNAISRSSRHRVVVVHFEDLEQLPALERFDAIVLHYSIVPCMDGYLPPWLRNRLRAYRGLKVAFLQDEYRWIDKSAATLAGLGVNVLFTVTGHDVARKIYRHPELKEMELRPVLTGYVDPELVGRDVPAYGDRPVDVGYRSRVLPAWLGELGQEKWRIGARFLEDAARFGLHCDIALEERDRLYGWRWIRFLESCKAVLGTESGASVCDFTDEIRQSVEAHAAKDPNVTFEELKREHFAAEDGKLEIRAISPRHFEAAALRSLMILYPGEYSGILQPWRHYVPLRKDHGNMAEVAEVLRDPPRAQAIVDAAYREVAQNPAYAYERLTEAFDELVAEHAAPLAPGIRVELPPVEEMALFAHASWRKGYVERRIIDAISSRQQKALRGLERHWPAGARQGLCRRLIVVWVYFLARGAIVIFRGLLHPVRVVKIVARRLA